MACDDQRSQHVERNDPRQRRRPCRITCRVGMEVSGQMNIHVQVEFEQTKQSNNSAGRGRPLLAAPGGRMFLDDEMVLQNRKLLCRHVNTVCIH
jgi:hypothetical protein